MNLRIYNSENLLIFQSNEQAKGWDGTYKGNEMPADYYFYILYATLLNGEELAHKKIVELIR